MVSKIDDLLGLQQIHQMLGLALLCAGVVNGNLMFKKYIYHRSVHHQLCT